MVRPMPDMDGANAEVLPRLLDDAQVLAPVQDHPDHLAIKPSMQAVVQERRCMDFFV